MATVLVVGSAPNHRRLASLARRNGHRALLEPKVNNALRTLSLDRIDLVIVHSDAATDGSLADIVARICANRVRIPLVLLGDHENDQLVTGGFTMGAQDSGWSGDVGNLPGSSMSTVLLTVDPVMSQMLNEAIQLAKADLPVVLCGESGTGKELVARAIHAAGSRRTGPFVPVNCGAVPETLVEAELFGYERGAFTGAVRRKQGLLQQADKGVLFLDEIGDMPPHTQVRLLRFLDSGEVRPIGDTTTRRMNVQTVAATNRDLQQKVAAGTFRHDLFYRLGGRALRLPPLRERRGDIDALAHHYLRGIAERLGRPMRGFSSEALLALSNYDWPGNVRELKNVIEYAAVMADSDIVREVKFSGAGEVADRPRLASPATRVHQQGSAPDVVAAVRATGGNHRQAARLLGISRTTLWRRLRSLGYLRPRTPTLTDATRATSE